jgi:hypothetical protein
MTALEAGASRLFRELRAEVTEAAYQMVEANLDGPDAMFLTDAVLGATLAALLERGWLNVPDRRAS